MIDQINLGGTDAARAALLSGEIDTYWEYNGTAWISFMGGRRRSRRTSWSPTTCSARSG